jgi:predicted P-loop ATPase
MNQDTHLPEGKVMPDGKIDHITRVAQFFEDKDNTFSILLKKWLLGAVGRILSDHPGQQHPMLVLDGKQGMGKSRFVWWLGSPLPAFYLQNSINTQDKDFLINLISKWIWEVEELGATLRKQDIESLKAFITKEIVTVRKPYGHEDIVKPATASFIGTINNSGGFLADSTGNRRFRVCTLTKIDWDYEKQVNINDVWAQAVHLYKNGERWQLDADTNEKMNEINSRYEVDDPLGWDLYEVFNIDPDEKSEYTATAQIIKILRDSGRVTGGSDQQISNRIGNILSKAGCEKAQIRLNGQRARVWHGVWKR